MTTTANYLNVPLSNSVKTTSLKEFSSYKKTTTTATTMTATATMTKITFRASAVSKNYGFTLFMERQGCLLNADKANQFQ